MPRIIFFLIFSASLFAQDDSIAIRVNNSTISIQEFAARLNFMPQKPNSETTNAKMDLIVSLIAEAILADYAQKKGLASQEKNSLLKEQFYKEALYEQWMDSEVRSGIRIDEAELKKTYPHFREQKMVEFWTFNDKSGATKNRINILNNTKTDTEPQTKILEFGESLPHIEEAVYNLSKNEITEPILIDSVYYLFRLKKTILHPDHSKYDYHYWRPSLEKIIQQRKEKAVLDHRLFSLLNGKEFTIIKESFNFLHDQLYPIIYDSRNVETPETIQLKLESTSTQNSRSFDQVLIYFNDGRQWSIRDLWKKLAVSPYPLNYKNPADLKPGLKDVIQRTVLLESLAENAVIKEFHNSSYVQNENQMWSRNIDASSFIQNERDSVNHTEADLIKYYDSNKTNYIKPEHYKIIPVIVKEKSLAEAVYKQVIDGTDIISLAEQYSLNKLGLNATDPGIYVTKDTWGQIGPALSSLKAGEVSTPVKLADSSYAVIKLLEVKKSAPYMYHEVRDKVEALLIEDKLQQDVSVLLMSVVNSYDIKINRKAISGVEYYGGNMIVKKTHFPLRNMAPGFPVFNYKSIWYQYLINRLGIIK